MICNNITCVQDKIEDLEKNIDYYESVVNWQLDNIRQLNNQFLSMLQKEIEKEAI